MSAAFSGAEAAQAVAVLDHLNGNHPDTVLLVARHLRPGAVDAEVIALGPSAAVFALRLGDGVSAEERFVFPAPVDDVHGAQAHLLAAVGAARAAADPSTPLTSLEAELQVTATLPTVHGSVRRVARLTPSMLEVTLGGFNGYPLGGGDEFVYVMVSYEPGGLRPDYDMAQYRDSAPHDPVRGAYYTVRRARPEHGEIDLWVAEHDHPNTVAAWMAGAAEGSPLALWGPRRGFRLPADSASVALVADETGLAAAAAIIEAAAPEVQILGVFEAIGPTHRPPMPQHPGLRIEWVDRGPSAAGTENRLLARLRDALTAAAAEGRPTPDAAFGGAESRHISAVRRVLRTELGLPAARVSMTGYWRHPG